MLFIKMAARSVLAETVENVNRLLGGTAYDLSANVNLGSTLKIVQDAAKAQGALISEGKSIPGNPNSTMTSGYRNVMPTLPVLPLLSVASGTLPPLATGTLPPLSDLPLLGTLPVKR